MHHLIKFPLHSSVLSSTLLQGNLWYVVEIMLILFIMIMVMMTTMIIGIDDDDGYENDEKDAFMLNVNERHLSCLWCFSFISFPRGVGLVPPLYLSFPLIILVRKRSVVINAKKIEMKI